MILVQDRMSYNHSQNFDNTSSASITSSYDKPDLDLDSMYDNLSQTLKNLREKVKDITKSSSIDSNENSNYESLSFIIEV